MKGREVTAVYICYLQRQWDHQMPCRMDGVVAAQSGQQSNLFHVEIKESLSVHECCLLHLNCKGMCSQVIRELLFCKLYFKSIRILMPQSYNFHCEVQTVYLRKWHDIFCLSLFVWWMVGYLYYCVSDDRHQIILFDGGSFIIRLSFVEYFLIIQGDKCRIYCHMTLAYL